MSNTTFRFKFTDQFQEELNAFSKLHRYDNRHDFKNAWHIWLEENSSIVENESKILKAHGYSGYPPDKMYKSARYYFRKKSDKSKDPKRRRKYISLENNMITLIDNHIMNSVRSATFKPSTAFDLFCKKFSREITTEIIRLYSHENMNESEISTKFKKTYKNRYFQKFR